jgi:hypothetical protein
MSELMSYHETPQYNQFAESAPLMQHIRTNLRRLGYGL